MITQSLLRSMWLVLADDALSQLTLDVVSGESADQKTIKLSGLLFNGKLECASCHDVHNRLPLLLARR